MITQSLLEYLDQRYFSAERPRAFTLRIELINGNRMNVGVFGILSDGLVTDVRDSGDDYDRNERRFIPMNSILFFEVEF